MFHAILTLTVAAAWLPLTSATAAQPAAWTGTAGPEPLEVLVLAAAPAPGAEDLLDDLLHVPLEHLGLRPRRVDLGAASPPAARPGQRGLVFALRGDERLPSWLWPWLTRQAPGQRVVVVGSLEPLATAVGDRALFAAWLDRFGLADDGSPRTDPARVAVVARDAARCEYESPPAHAIAHVGPRVRDRGLDVWLATIDVGSPQVRRAPVVTGAFGGIALQPFAWRPGSRGARRWHVDPFAFLRAAFALDGVPVADPAVRFGCRRFVLDIEAAGHDAPSRPDRRATCADVLARDLLDRFRLPATLIVPADLAAALPPGLAALLRRPWVAPALAGAVTTPAEVDALAGCRTVVWPADAPLAAATAERLGAAGIAVVGDGSTRRDALHDTLTCVEAAAPAAPAAFAVRAAAVAASTFDAPDAPLPGAIRHLGATFVHTGGERILKPVHLRLRCDVAAADPARRDALERLIEEHALAARTAPCTIAEYATAVAAAVRDVEVERTEAGWRVRGAAGCPTLRIDGELRDVDLGASRGVLGTWRRGAALFVHLGGDTAEIALAAEPAPRPHVARAEAALTAVELAPDGVAMVAAGHPGRRVELGGFAAGAPLRVTVDGRVELREADRDGRLALVISDVDAVELRVVAR